MWIRIRRIQKIGDFFSLVDQTRSFTTKRQSFTKSSLTLLRAELQKSKLTIFEPLDDYGYFNWDPTGGYIPLSSIESAKDITKYILLDGIPEDLADHNNIRLPLRFQDLPKYGFNNDFPYGQASCVGLHVAQKYRGLALSSDIAQREENVVDFCFGGSTLGMLAQNNEKGDSFCVTKIPGTNVILVMKCESYTQDLSAPGFQFERLLTGKSMGDKEANPITTEHLHTMKVGSFTVLFKAEVDALYKSEPVEITASNSRYWGNKKIFQMISSGSPYLCQGSKGNGRLVNIELRTLSSCVEEANKYNTSCQLAERRIVLGMERIKKQMEHTKHGQLYQINFPDGLLKLTAAKSPSPVVLLPPEKIIHELLNYS